MATAANMAPNTQTIKNIFRKTQKQAWISAVVLVVEGGCIINVMYWIMDYNPVPSALLSLRRKNQFAPVRKGGGGGVPDVCWRAAADRFPREASGESEEWGGGGRGGARFILVFQKKVHNKYSLLSRRSGIRAVRLNNEHACRP